MVSLLTGYVQFTILLLLIFLSPFFSPSLSLSLVSGIGEKREKTKTEKKMTKMKTKNNTTIHLGTSIRINTLTPQLLKQKGTGVAGVEHGDLLLDIAAHNKNKVSLLRNPKTDKSLYRWAIHPTTVTVLLNELKKWTVSFPWFDGGWVPCLLLQPSTHLCQHSHVSSLLAASLEAQKKENCSPKKKGRKWTGRRKNERKIRQDRKKLSQRNYHPTKWRKQKDNAYSSQRMKKGERKEKEEEVVEEGQAEDLQLQNCTPIHTSVKLQPNAYSVNAHFKQSLQGSSLRPRRHSKDDQIFFSFSTVQRV